MGSSLDYAVLPATREIPTDVELEFVLRRVYVGEGFTSEELALEMFSAEAVRGRGEVLVAISNHERQLIGTTILVLPGSPSLGLATSASEAELHLLAVLPEFRKQGVGRRLVTEVLTRARLLGLKSVILWTQPSMLSAHRLYQSTGFKRCAERDFRKYDRDFWVMKADL